MAGPYPSVKPSLLLLDQKEGHLYPQMSDQGFHLKSRSQATKERLSYFNSLSLCNCIAGMRVGREGPRLILHRHWLSLPGHDSMHNMRIHYFLYFSEGKGSLEDKMMEAVYKSRFCNANCAFSM